MTDMKTNASLQIVFFDGVCHLCNGFVDFVIQNETKKNLIFAPLQGETAERYLKESDRKALDTVLFLQNGTLYRESRAILKILTQMGGLWKILGHIGAILPESLSNKIYRWVAKNRYQWFGKSESCRLPKPEERNQLWP